MIWHVRALDDRSKEIKGASLVMLLDLLNALRWQDRLSKGLTGYLLIEVRQVGLVTHCRYEWRLNPLL